MEPQALLVLVNVPPADWCYCIDTSRKLIGRAIAAAIPIPVRYLSVSRQHAEIWCDERGIWLCDLGARGGTRVNGIWLKANEPSAIVIGDRLKFGAAELHLEPPVRPTANDPVANKSASLTTAEVETIVHLPRALVSRAFLDRLTYAEHNLVLWMARGYVHDDDLCRLMHRSRNTIRTQIANILKKLDAHSRISVLSQLHRENTAIETDRAKRNENLP